MNGESKAKSTISDYGLYALIAMPLIGCALMAYGMLTADEATRKGQALFLRAAFGL